MAKQLRETTRQSSLLNKAIQTYEKVSTPDGILRDWLVLKFPSRPLWQSLSRRGGD